MWSFVSVYSTAGEPWFLWWCYHHTAGSTGCIEPDTDATQEAAPTFRLNSGWDAFRKSHSQVFSTSSAEQWIAAAGSHTTIGRGISDCCFVQHRGSYSSEHCCLPTSISFRRFQFISCLQLVHWVAGIVIQRRPGSIVWLQRRICCWTIRVLTVMYAIRQEAACTGVHWRGVITAGPANDPLPFSTWSSAHSNFEFETASRRISTLARFPQDEGGNCSLQLSPFITLCTQVILW